VLFVRAQDIPEYVESGAAELGITGLDLVLETRARVRRLLDLGFGRCRLVLAAPEDAPFSRPDEIPAGSRVATAFPNLTRDYFERARRPVRIVPVSGAAEITPAIGVADLVVDLVDTGTTLRQNHLRLMDILMDSEAVLIACEDTAAKRAGEIEAFVASVRSVLDAEGRRYLMANVPRTRLAEATALLPGLAAPTIMDLADRDWVAVHAVVREDEINDLIPRLREAGATGILVLPIERLVP
jgi:ATP phosphoribosyltransferase